ncbi:MAG TPA: hypothetical protein VGP24_02775 [Glaciihabitans sp.]|jgi:hypothetical protein|nr:hypothetical protein [Glaciihabitans sp.]
MMTSPGYTTAEIRQIVQEYQLQPYGRKSAWLAEQGLPAKRVQRWQAAVFDGDLDLGLIPREGSSMTTPPHQRTVIAKELAKQRTKHEAELERLTARVRELEDTNTALGKAIGLLHTMNEQEPDKPAPTTDPPSSSPQRPHSSANSPESSDPNVER